MLGNVSKLSAPLSSASRSTAALRSIQIFFWLTTVTVVSIFATFLTWVSFDHLFQFTTQALSLERQITSNIVRYHVEEYLSESGYHALLPGKTDTGLNRLLDDLVKHNPSILNIRVVNQERFHVATAGTSAASLLGADQRDICCSVFDIAAQKAALSDRVTGDFIAESKSIAGRFHDPHTLGVYCVDAPLMVDGQFVGMVAIHEDNPLSRSAYQEAKRSNQILIFAASALLLAALTLTVIWTSREMRRLDERITQSDRNASLGNLAAGVAHEIRNPLNTIALSCNFLERKISTLEPEARESLDLISGEVKRLKGTIDNFVRFARQPRLAISEVDIDEILDSVVELLSPEIEAASIKVVRERASDARVVADRARLREAMVNLVRNAIQAIVGKDRAGRGQSGKITITTRATRAACTVEVADDGVGIAPESLRHLFEPYFTTKPDGLGLGLAMARQDIAAHGGEIEVASEPGKGTTFRVRIPAAS